MAPKSALQKPTAGVRKAASETAPSHRGALARQTVRAEAQLREATLQRQQMEAAQDLQRKSAELASLEAGSPATSNLKVDMSKIQSKIFNLGAQIQVVRQAIQANTPVATDSAGPSGTAVQVAVYRANSPSGSVASEPVQGVVRPIVHRKTPTQLDVMQWAEKAGMDVEKLDLNDMEKLTFLMGKLRTNDPTEGSSDEESDKGSVVLSRLVENACQSRTPSVRSSRQAPIAGPSAMPQEDTTPFQSAMGYSALPTPPVGVTFPERRTKIWAGNPVEYSGTSTGTAPPISAPFPAATGGQENRSAELQRLNEQRYMDEEQRAIWDDAIHQSQLPIPNLSQVADRSEPAKPASAHSGSQTAGPARSPMHQPGSQGFVAYGKPKSPDPHAGQEQSLPQQAPTAQQVPSTFPGPNQYVHKSYGEHLPRSSFVPQVSEVRHPHMAAPQYAAPMMHNHPIYEHIQMP